MFESSTEYSALKYKVKCAQFSLCNEKFIEHDEALKK